MLTVVTLVALLVAGVLIAAAMKGDTFHVERSTTIDAPPSAIYPLVEDFRRWVAWSPYEKLDPAMTRTISGAASGPGAVYEWSGNSKAGAGRMEITRATPPSQIVIRLDFSKPFEAHNTATFTMAPSGARTAVTWAMDGPSPFITKVVGLFMNMDRMIGRDFETGLANLKRVAEEGGDPAEPADEFRPRPASKG
jgi:uncharacterized protein YndB with AHSA1/START domain